MSVITSAEVLQLTGMDVNPNSQNLVPQIDSLIPVVENWLVKHLANYFHTPNWVSSLGFVFDKETRTIEIGSGQDTFTGTNIAFVAGMDFHVDGSINNDGVYSAQEVDEDTITVDEKYAIEDESFNNDLIYIYRIKWPVGLKYPVAKAIEFDMGKTRAANEQPSRQNPFDSDKAYRYPQRIMEGFRPWSRMRVG